MTERGIERLNSLAHDEAEGELLKCCGSTAWACAMSASRPFGDADELERAADEIWSKLARGVVGVEPRVRGEVRSRLHHLRDGQERRRDARQLARAAAQRRRRRDQTR